MERLLPPLPAAPALVPEEGCSCLRPPPLPESASFMGDLLMLSYVESGMHGADVSTLSICKDQGALLVAATPLPVG